MNQRYEREIRELLEKMDTFVPEESRRRKLWRQVRWWIADARDRLSPVGRGSSSQQLMLLSYGLAIAAYVVGAFIRPFGWGLGQLAALLFLAAYIGGILERRRTRYQPRWRGRVIEYRRSTSLSSWREWLQRWRGRRW